MEDNKKQEGLKFDNGKLQWDLLPFDALEEIAKVLEFGATKYGRENWKKGLTIRRLVSATLRHTFSFLKGETFDKETNLNHMAHAGANVLFILWMLKNKPEFDDRTIEND